MSAFEVDIRATREDAERALAHEIATRIRAGRLVLGLATGRTPVGVYAELIRMHREEGLSFQDVITFNLDEFEGLAPDDPGSFRAFMKVHLFDHVDLRPENVHLLPSDAGDGAQAACDAFERAIRAAGGIDLQVLGLGLNGHVGFNEPGSPAESRTRRVELHPVTRRSYGQSLNREAPTHALTMGVATIREARALRILALGESKADIVAEVQRGKRRDEVPATLLRDHTDARLIVDSLAAGALASHETNSNQV